MRLCKPVLLYAHAVRCRYAPLPDTSFLVSGLPVWFVSP